jgi:hypothetical protein
VLLDSAQVADPRSLSGVRAALASVGKSTTDYDIVFSVNIDPSRSEGGFMGPCCEPVFAYMGNFGGWHEPVTSSGFTSIAGAVYHHEVAHAWGWPGTHDWAKCAADYGFNFRVPAVLLGWEDVDGDGVPEVLDTTPYGRLQPPPISR